GNEVALADAVRWIAKHRKVRELLEHGDRGDVHGVARVGLEGADAALAKHEVVVAAGEDVFGGEQNLFNGGGDAALEQAGLAHVPELAEQVEVLHVARTDLEAVDVREHDLDLRDLHDLGDDEQAVFIGSLAHDLQPFNAHALEAVRRAARLERTAAKELRTGSGALFCAEANLVAAFDRAWAGHDDDLFATDDDTIRELDARAFRAEAAAGELVGRRDAVGLRDTGEHLELSDLKVRGRADA